MNQYIFSLNHEYELISQPIETQVYCDFPEIGDAKFNTQ